jgi:uncharacterized protein (UPF0210 family)
MPFSISKDEILETVAMLHTENLDIRTITMGIDILSCHAASGKQCGQKIYDKILCHASQLVKVGDDIEKEYGIPIINKRISVTPVALVADGLGQDDMIEIGRHMDKASGEVGVNFIGGFSALVHKGFSRGDSALLAAIPETLSVTERVCSSVNLATTKAGINMDAVAGMGRIIKETARLTADRDGWDVPNWWSSVMLLKTIFHGRRLSRGGRAGMHPQHWRQRTRGRAQCGPQVSRRRSGRAGQYHQEDRL